MVHIHCEKIEIEEVSNSSAILSGDNVAVNWSHIQKTNDGFGDYSGDYLLSIGNKQTVIAMKPKGQKGCSTWNEKERESEKR